MKRYSRMVSANIKEGDALMTEHLFSEKKAHAISDEHEVQYNITI